MSANDELTPIDHTLRKAAAALQAADIPFILGGSLACWARGAPRSHNDVDLMVAPPDAEDALAALVQAGMRAERPPEDWLVKAYDGEVCVDVIFAPRGVDIDRDYIAGAEQLAVLAIQMPVMATEDVLVSRLLAIDAHRIDYTALVAIVRALREQIDWASLARRVGESPYARGFLALVRELEIVPSHELGDGVDVRRVRRVQLG